MIETYLLEQFVAFAECGTLLKASEKLHITQPSLSRSMKKLEDELGVNLFERGSSKLMLNGTGKVAYDYAVRTLQANQEMIDRVLSYDRSLRTISIGSCAPMPLYDLIPTLQERLPGKTLSTELVDDDVRLITGLKNRAYQLCILHEEPEDRSIFTQRIMEEQLYVALPVNHKLARRKNVTFKALRGVRILVNAQIGFWMEICRDKLIEGDLLVQTNNDAMNELIESSTLPFFISDQFMNRGYTAPDRIIIPISDDEAHATYRLACLVSEQKNYRPVFNTVRGDVIRQG
ncbi:MAG: LysR family transcriptional regulator [Clostridiales bacterium]|nr:LysR family transcriptional regulator [Clostridiales bacterium]